MTSDDIYKEGKKKKKIINYIIGKTISFFLDCCNYNIIRNTFLHNE